MVGAQSGPPTRNSYKQPPYFYVFLSVITYRSLVSGLNLNVKRSRRAKELLVTQSPPFVMQK